MCLGPSRALAYSEIVDLGHRIQLAGFHVVAICRDPAAIDIAGHLYPGIDTDVLTSELGLYEDGPSNGLNQGGGRRDDSQETAKEREKIRTLLNQAKAAFEGLHRKGFSKEPEPDSALAEGFRVGTEIIVALMKPFENFARTAKAIAAEIPGGDDPFSIDKTRFCGHLIQLYGGHE
mgnify:CR=1 FL=1